MAISEQKPPPIRNDLEVVPQYYRGELCYVAKDPVTLRYYRLREAEYIVLECFRQGMNADQIQREVKKKTGFEISAVEIFKFANQLRGSDLLKSKGMEDVGRLAKNRDRVRKARFKQFISNYLFVTIPVWDPDRMLEKLLPYFSFLFKPFFLVLAVLVTGAAFYVVVDNFKVLVADAFSMLSGWNLLILSAVIFSVKFIHEMGHALTCKYYGGEVHAIGPAFLVFQPCMFTDTTDAWLFPDKWHRVLVTAAGIISEVLLASVAALVWISSDPGILKQVAYTTMMACSIHTIVFNANPLLRFDGYYVLTDLVEIPNLRLKTSRYLGYLFDRYVLGIKATEPYMQPGERTIHLVYGIARFLFRILIVLSIGLFLYSIFEPLGIFMWLTSLYGMAVMPIWKRGKELARQYSAGEVRIRYILVIAAAVTVVGALWFVPMDYTIRAPCVVAAPEMAVVRTGVRGTIDEILVRPGQRVSAGEPVARMSNPELTHGIRRIAALIQESDARLRGALALDAASYQMELRQKAKLVEELKELQEQADRLVVRAPREGTVVNLHQLEIRAVKPQQGFVEYPDSDEVGDLSRFAGMTVPAGTGLLGVAAPGGFQFETFVYEHDISSLSPGDEMVSILASNPSEQYTSHVRSVTPVDVKEIENVGITLADVGYIPVKPTPDGRSEPLITLYMVHSELLAGQEGLPWGLTGKTLITFGRGPAGTFLFGRLVRALRLRLQSIS